MGRINQLVPTTTVTANSVIAVDAASGGVTNKLAINTLAAGLRSIGDYATQTQLVAKQDKLTFDTTPTEDSDNPVTSGGVYNAFGTAMGNVYTKAQTDAEIANSKPVIYDKVITGVSVSTDGGYSAAIPYSTISSSIVYAKIISCFLRAWSANAILVPQPYTDGLYIYSTKAFANGNVHVRIVCLP